MKLFKFLRKNIKTESNLKLEDAKEGMQFERRPAFSWKWARRISIVPIAIAVALIIGITNNPTNVSALNAVVTIDINPSIIISLDEDNNVIGIEAINADGETLLLEVDLEEQDLETVVRDILEAAEEQGFVLESDTILLSIQTEDGETTEELELDLYQAIEDEAEEMGKEIEVVVQKYKTILDTESSVISQAKATLIEALILTGDYTTEDIDELATMKINELKDILEDTYSISIQDVMSNDDDAKEDAPGQVQLREKYTEEILELGLLTQEEIDELDTKDLKDVLKDYYKVSEEKVKDEAEDEIDDYEKDQLLDILVELGLGTEEELSQMDVDDLEDMLEEYYESIEDDEEAKEEAKEKNKEAKEKAEERKTERIRVKDLAYETSEELYAAIALLEEQFNAEIAQLKEDLDANRENMTEEEIAEAEEHIAELEEDYADILADHYEEAIEMVQEELEEAMEDEEKAREEAEEMMEKQKEENEDDDEDDEDSDEPEDTDDELDEEETDDEDEVAGGKSREKLIELLVANGVVTGDQKGVGTKELEELWFEFLLGVADTDYTADDYVDLIVRSGFASAEELEGLSLDELIEKWAQFTMIDGKNPLDYEDEPGDEEDEEEEEPEDEDEEEEDEDEEE